MELTLVTAWFIMSSKFSPETYDQWITIFLSGAKHFNLVVFTDKRSLPMISRHTDGKKNIYVNVIDIENFHGYKYRNQWQTNQSNNKNPLRNSVSWEVNMLWCEKINLVAMAMDAKYFDTDWYGWCDIGYFRDFHSTAILQSWPNQKK